MRKTFLVLVGLFCLMACGQTKTEVKVEKLPEVNSIEEMEAIGMYYSFGIYIQFKGTDETILYSGDDGTFMFINGKVERLESVEKEGIWEYKNETYKIVLNVKITKDEETEWPVYDGEISVTNLKTNASKTIKIDGYWAD